MKGCGILIATGFDRAFLGVGRRCGEPDLAVYDSRKAFVELMRRDNLTWDEALEYYDFNVEGAWVGEQSPIWLHRTTVAALRRGEEIE